MKILFVAPYVPSRIRVRPFHFILELAEKHEVHVLALEEPGGALHEGVDTISAAVESFQIIPHSKLLGYARCLLALGTISPMCTAYSRSRAMEEACAKAVEREHFDVVHVEHLRAAGFASAMKRVPVVIDAVDCLTNLFRLMARTKKNPVSRLINTRESVCLSRCEPSALSRFDRLVVTTHSERQALRSLSGYLSPEVVPNGVAADYFAPQGTQKHPKRLIFTGKMSYAPNAQAVIWFARHVFPSLRESHPEAEFFIVGSDPPAKVMKLTQSPGITVTGYVPDMRPYMDSASIAVATMQVAVGIQNKILEAMAMGVPVIASRCTCRAFGDTCPGVIPANTPDEVTGEILHLLENPGLATAMGKDGRKKVLAEFTWQSSAAKLEHIYGDLLHSREQSKVI